MIEETVLQRDESISPHRIFDMAGSILGGSNIPASQAFKLAIVIVDLFRDMERLQHEAD